ncbi:MAG: RagB/SusD family nutrient uptake outer membrane protein [Bacteroidales bacterium]|nr:RagB/SusD family nutrient uptake outer membrane protein [Bacteroidales bacterium]
MKHFAKILIALSIVSVSMASCTKKDGTPAGLGNKFLEVNLYDQATLDEIFAKGTTAQRYLAHLYSFIPQDESINNRAGWVVARSDEAQFSWTQWVNYLTFREGNYSSATSVSYSGSVDTAEFLTWSKLYKGISQCSVFLDNIDKMQEFGNKTPEEISLLIRQMKAEAVFLRAYYYYCLFRQYGPVYLWKDENGDAITPDIKVDATSIERNTVQECFDFILSELDKSIADLPLHVGDYGEQAAGWLGRATKGAAMAVKARVALMQASPLYNGQNGTGLYDNFVSKSNGKKFFPDYDASKWEIAARAQKDLIDLADGGEYALMENTISDPNPMQVAASDYEAIFQKQWNSETIWGWWKRESSEYGSYVAGAGQIIVCTLANGLELAGYSGITPSLKLVDAFPMQATGRYPLQLGNMYQKTNDRLDYSKPNVDPLSGYKADGWTEDYEVPVNASWAPAFKAHNSTVGRDARYYQCLVPSGFPWPDKNRTNGTIFFSCYNSASCSSPWVSTGDANRVGYIWRKWYPTDRPLNDWSAYQMQVVYPSIRLAEIYLNYAECLIEQSAPDLAGACVYINKVRHRAGLNNIEAAYPGIDGDRNLLREALRMERMVEFNGETLRHYDCVRWMTAKEEYTTYNWTLKCSAPTLEEQYQRVNDDYVGGGNPTFTDRDYLFPIYSQHLAEMTNMTQNPGF